MSDEELIEQTLAGNKEAFGLLARKYQDRVYNLALPIVGNHEDALDVVQDAFLQALSHLSSFRRSSRFYTWLYRIAYNCAVGVLRKRDKRKGEGKIRIVSVDANIDEYGETLESKDAPPDAEAKRKDDARLIRAALDKLPEEYRIPLVLREIGGSNYEQIAETLGVPVGTVRSRLHRARAAMKELLGRAGLSD